MAKESVRSPYHFECPNGINPLDYEIILVKQNRSVFQHRAAFNNIYGGLSMGEIITGVFGLFVAGVGVVLKRIYKNTTDGKLKGADVVLACPLIFLFLYGLAALILYGWYLFATRFDCPIFPVWPDRSPTDWFLDAVVIVGSFATWLCWKLADFYYAQWDTDPKTPKKRLRLLALVTVFILFLGLVSYLYQVYFYGWWPW